MSPAISRLASHLGLMLSAAVGSRSIAAHAANAANQALLLPNTLARGSRNAVLADRVAVRFFSAETGGSGHPKWISERWLVFQATLEALGEGMRAPSERHMRLALELEIGETLLSLSPNERLLAQADEVRLVAELRAEQERRVGGTTAFTQLAAQLNIPSTQLISWYARKARALHYVDRMIAPIRNFDDGELRQAFRSHDSHEFGSTFEEARDGLRHWLMVERFRALVSAHFQAARGRTKVVIVAP